MRYIKKYKVFESKNDEVEEEIKDILIELEDEDFQITYDRKSNTFFNEKTPGVYIQITIRLDKNMKLNRLMGAPVKTFKWGDVKETILRLFNWYQNYTNFCRFEILGLGNAFKEFKEESDFEIFPDSRLISQLYIYARL